MKSFKTLFVSLFFLFAMSNVFGQQAKYRCMLQMTNYQGLEAYVVVSLINPDGKYEKTLYMMGPDKQWYNGFKEWDKHLSKKKENLSAITGASVAAGDRSITTFTIDESLLDKGYKLRFESSVEDKINYASDVEIPLTKTDLTKKIDGTGYIRYVKLNKVQ